MKEAPRNVTPARLAAAIHWELLAAGFELADMRTERVTRKPHHGRGHTVQEHHFTVLSEGRPVIVSVRIADTRRAPAYPPPTENPDDYWGDAASFTFDGSGLPLRDE
jgi:hypothetical protein